jgi:hypothetical protein
MLCERPRRTPAVLTKPISLSTCGRVAVGIQTPSANRTGLLSQESADGAVPVAFGLLSLRTHSPPDSVVDSRVSRLCGLGCPTALCTHSVMDDFSEAALTLRGWAQRPQSPAPHAKLSSQVHPTKRQWAVTASWRCACDRATRAQKAPLAQPMPPGNLRCISPVSPPASRVTRLAARRDSALRRAESRFRSTGTVKGCFVSPGSSSLSRTWG